MEWAEALVPAVLVALAIVGSIAVGIIVWRRWVRHRRGTGGLAPVARPASAHEPILFTNR